MGFERLHPALQYHIVNSVGWTELREVQEACIDPILAGKDVVILAETAGGKTEAAFFPLISRMLSEHWGGLSILYISPLRALLNNQGARLKGYFELVGYVASTWHGDVTQGDKRRVLRDPPACLLTTPESLEAMMASSRVDHARLLGDVQAVVVDEVHAFAGDDRGWHLLSLLSRISQLAGRHVQRIGLSATVGNPKQLVHWLGGGHDASGSVVMPTAIEKPHADVQLDHVGSLQNAATLISRLYRGEKRLVFCDSRAQVEQLASMLRGLDVQTFVTHSSVSRELRQHAESGFASETNCVIVATSALELGIDIGDLDRVIQVNSPGSVAAFLQRMGRTGRRPNKTTNCLLLALDVEDVVDCAALMTLWCQGYVEPVDPPPLPFHIFAQQVMALALQNHGLSYGQWDAWLSAVPAFLAMTDDDKRSIVSYMVNQGLLSEDQGVLWFGRQGEKAFGRRNFMELLSVFASAPTLIVRHGTADIGMMDRLPLEMTIRRRRDEGEPLLLTLAGRHWRVVHIDWTRRIVLVQESEYRGRSSWLGTGKAVSFEIAQSRLGLLLTGDENPLWSRRARAAIDEARNQYNKLSRDALTLLEVDNDRWECWTFGGTRANMLLSLQIQQDLEAKVQADALRVVINLESDPETIARGIAECLRKLLDDEDMIVPTDAIDALKFHLCVPATLARRLVHQRWIDEHAIRHLLNANIRVVHS